MSELTLQLPDDVMARLQREAKRQQMALDDLVLAALESYLNNDELTREAILESLRQSMHDALQGRVRPAHAVLAELRQGIRKQADDFSIDDKTGVH